MTYLLITGIIGILFGLSLIILPELLKKLSEFADKHVMHVDGNIFAVRRVLGFTISLISIYMLYIALGSL